MERVRTRDGASIVLHSTGNGPGLVVVHGGGVNRLLHDRLRALRCWATTQRNTCAWVAGVHGYLETDDQDRQQGFRDYLAEMIALDLDNTRELLDLWETSSTEVLLVSDIGETSSIFGENFGDLLRRKIELTERYADRTPYIDREILWRLA